MPFVLGGCGSGRTTMLRRLQAPLRRTAPASTSTSSGRPTTPERFLRAVIAASPFAAPVTRTPSRATPRDAFDATLAFFATGAGRRRRPGDVPARRSARAADLRELPRACAAPSSRAPRLPGRQPATASCWPRGTRRGRTPAARDVSCRASAVPGRRGSSTAGDRRHAPAPSTGTDATRRRDGPRAGARATSPMRCALTDGRAAYVEAIAETHARDAREPAGGDPVSALAALMCPGGRLAARCGTRYELRLHRARGYGALKAILDDPRGGRTADADRGGAAAAPDAGIDQGLPVVARGRRPRDGSRRKRYRFRIRCCGCGSACTAVRPRPATRSCARRGPARMRSAAAVRPARAVAAPRRGRRRRREVGRRRRSDRLTTRPTATAVSRRASAARGFLFGFLLVRPLATPTSVPVHAHLDLEQLVGGPDRFPRRRGTRAAGDRAPAGTPGARDL